jgi:hypothetical protein
VEEEEEATRSTEVKTAKKRRENTEDDLLSIALVILCGIMALVHKEMGGFSIL